LACVPAWGIAKPGYEAKAEALGLAFQLTNIVRDLNEDYLRGRVYLPADECARFDAPPQQWPGGGFEKLLSFQIDRAKYYYSEAAGLDAFLQPPARKVVAAMTGVYSQLLRRVERAGVGVWQRRVRVPKWRKAASFAGAWLFR
jgi:15-cis-phytoene synthase